MSESLSLLELNSLVRQSVEDSFAGRVWVRGELAEGREASGGHFYGELVERSADGRGIVARARVNCWAGTYRLVRQDFLRQTGRELGAGLKVLLQVSVTFHEKYGYSLTAHDIDPSYTIGDAARRRWQILEQLRTDGLLEAQRGLALPTLTLRIAVVSSPTAAGYGDFQSQLLGNPGGYRFTMRLFPALMQGDGMEQSVTDALCRIEAEAAAWDVVVIIRGGGAVTDLGDFDNYPLAVCVAQFPLPVITGIGHERDTTVLDYVAHTSLKTPTAVAAFLVSLADAQAARVEGLCGRLTEAARRSLLLERRHVAEAGQRLAVSAQRNLSVAGRRLGNVAMRLPLACRSVVGDGRIHLSRVSLRLSSALRMRIRERWHCHELLEARLRSLDPRLPLSRGYSITLAADGRLVRDVSALRRGTCLRTIVEGGDIVSEVVSAEPSSAELSAQPVSPVSTP